MLGWIGAPELAVLGSRRNWEFEYPYPRTDTACVLPRLLDPASSANP
jgi:hypothetical protein